MKHVLALLLAGCSASVQALDHCDPNATNPPFISTMSFDHSGIYWTGAGEGPSGVLVEPASGQYPAETSCGVSVLPRPRPQGRSNAASAFVKDVAPTANLWRFKIEAMDAGTGMYNIPFWSLEMANAPVTEIAWLGAAMNLSRSRVYITMRVVGDYEQEDVIKPLLVPKLPDSTPCANFEVKLVPDPMLRSANQLVVSVSCPATGYFHQVAFSASDSWTPMNVRYGDLVETTTSHAGFSIRMLEASVSSGSE